jgi:hypothetical protein
MTRRLDDLQDRFADSKLFAVAYGSMRKLNAGFFAEDDLGARACGDFLVAAHEICVQVCFDDVLDLETLRRSFREIFVDITLRIDNHRLTIGANQIRRVR